MNKRIATLFFAVFVSAILAFADDTQLELRLNPEIEAPSAEARYSSYPFMKPSANVIELNGDDWTALSAKFAAAARGDSLFSLVYLGDSHVQADFGGSVLRSRLQAASRCAGRGLVIPFRLASTNQPKDYTIHTYAPFTASKLLKMPWPTAMPFTGIGIRPEVGEFSLSLKCEMPFDRLRMLYLGKTPEIIRLYNDNGDVVPFDSISAYKELCLRLGGSFNELSLEMRGDIGDTTFGGFELLGDTVGTVVHSLGNNGATYSSYGLVEGFAQGLAKLTPDLTVIALGTNEAFSRNNPENILAGIETLVATVRQNNPQTKIVLVGPAECYKKTYRRVRNKKGRWRRVASSVVNKKVLTVRNIIKEYAASEGLPYYDHYEVAGGTGAAAKLKKARILGKDGVHYTADGYRLWGDLLADALLKAMCAEPK